MLPNQGPCQTPHLNSTDSANNSQISTQFEQYVQRPPTCLTSSSQNSKQLKDALVYSTDEEQSNRELKDSVEEIILYGQRIFVDFHEEDSINSFLWKIERKKNFSSLTKESIKIVVLQKAVHWKKQLIPLLQNAYEKYQKMIMKTIFN